MRRTPHAPRPRRRTPATALAAVLAAAALLSAPARAQEAAKAKAAAPPPPDTRPLARYAPAERLAMLLEVHGTDSQADAWAKTAAYRLLNETTLGEMLELVLKQTSDRMLATRAGNKMSGADLVTVFKHAAKKGVLVASVAPGAAGEKPATFAVFKGGAGKDVRASFSRLMGTLMGNAKPQVGKKGTRTVITVPGAGPGQEWVWWSEGNDLVISTAGGEDTITAVLDGKSPGAVDHPARAELVKADGDLSPYVTMFLDPAAAPPAVGVPSPLAMLTNALKGSGVKRVDLRYGFQGDALMGVTRVQAPKPRKGLLALFDQPSFDKSKLPPLPEGSEAFAVLSVQPAKALDVLQSLAASAGPQAGAVTGSLDALKSRTKVDLKKDLLPHLGPKMSFFVMPGGSPARATAKKDAGDQPPAEGAAPPSNPLAGMLGGLVPPGVSLPGVSGPFPRYTLVAEIDDPVAFGKTLDNVMVAMNKELRAEATARAEEAAKAAAASGNPGGEPGRPGFPGAPGGPGGGGDSDGARTKRRTPPPAPEFRLVPGKDKTFVLSVPTTMARSFPQGFRPTVQLGAKHVAISTSPDAANQALALKAGGWSAPADLAPTFEKVPGELVFLSVSDPRTSTPELLAALPANLQRGVNTVLLTTQAGAGAAPGGAPGNNEAAAGGGSPGSPAPGSSVGGPGGPGGRKGGFIAATPPGGGPGATSPGGGPPGYPGAPGGGGAPGYPGAPGGGGAPGGESADSAPALLTFDIPAEKLPKPDDLRSRMFPGALAVTSDDQEIRFINRNSFPGFVSPATALGVAFALPALQAARGVPPGAAPGAGAPPGVAPGGPVGTPPPGGQPGFVPGAPGGGGRRGGFQGTTPGGGGANPASPG